MGDDSKKSVFNAGVAQAERIDSLQRALNSARFNPIAQNPEVGKFNYEIMASACDGLFYEAWGKLTDTEKEEGQRIKTIIHSFIEHRAIISRVNGEMVINKRNLSEFMVLIDLYEKKNKEYLDEHNLNSPSHEDDDDEY